MIIPAYDDALLAHLAVTVVQEHLRKNLVPPVGRLLKSIHELESCRRDADRSSSSPRP